VDTLNNKCVYIIIVGADAVSAVATAAVKSTSQPVFDDVAHIWCGFPKVC
jgi:hypothetical protein